MKKLKLKYIFTAIFLIGIVVVSITTIFNTNTNIKAKKENSKNSIIVNNDTDTPLAIPKIATKLHETELKNNLDYEFFVQNTSAIRTLNKGDINLWSNQNRANSPIATRKLANNNYLIALRGTHKGKGGAITFVEVNENGVVQNFYDDIDLDLRYYSRLNGMLEQTEDGKYLSYGFKIVNGMRKELFFEVDLTKTANGKLSVTSYPATQLTSEMRHPHEIRFFRKDDITKEILIGGFISSHPLKIPLGTFDLVDKKATYKLSLNNVAPSTIIDHYKEKGIAINKLSHIIPMDIIKLPNGDYFSIINYYDYFIDVDTPLVSTVQVFDSKGVRKQLLLPDQIAQGNSTGYDEGYVIKVTGSFVYYFIKDGTKSYIKKYNFEKQTTETVKTFPKETYLKISVNDDGIVSFYGYASSLLEDDFKGFYDISGNFIVFGVMKDLETSDPFKIETLTPNPVNNNVLINYVDRVNNDKYFISGSTTSTNFGTPTLPSEPEYSPYFMGLYGSIIHKEDFSPALYARGDVTLNINDPDLNDQNTLSNWLLTGSKTGNHSDPLAIKATDTTDLKNPILGETIQERQHWLNKRINKNFENLDLPIDWSALGLDLNDAGPQSIVYFIGDSQKQLTSASRWVNAVTDQTVQKEEVYLDAQNFSVPLASVKKDIPSENIFKELAQTKIWNQVTHEIYEDGKNKKFSDKVTINQDQLKDLQEAIEAKPYPVDVTIEVVPNSGSTGGPNGSVPGENGDDDLDPGGSGTGGGGWVGAGNEPIKITNRVWVFVTTKNTVVDKSTGIVIYADDYRLPLQSAKNESMEHVYQHAHVKVYDYYDNSHETVSPLPTLADHERPEGLAIKNLEVITEAQEPGIVKPIISYTWDKGETYTTPDVTLYAELLLHTRQVILKESSELPVPTSGYLRLIYTKADEVNVTLASAIEKNNPAFTTNTIDFSQVTSGNEILFDLLIPEFYRYKGYTVSYENIPHQPSTLIEKQFKYSLINDKYEVWLTLYIEPSKSSSPNPYSWDYQNNKLGKITIE